MKSLQPFVKVQVVSRCLTTKPLRGCWSVWLPWNGMRSHGRPSSRVTPLQWGHAPFPRTCLQSLCVQMWMCVCSGSPCKVRSRLWAVVCTDMKAVGTAIMCRFYPGLGLRPTPTANSGSWPILLEPLLSQTSGQENRFEEEFLQLSSGHITQGPNLKTQW